VRISVKKINHRYTQMDTEEKPDDFVCWSRFFSPGEDPSLMMLSQDGAGLFE
jgi:hypothetical protein